MNIFVLFFSIMYQDFKENKIRGRYVTFQMIKPILDNYKHWLIEEGRSVLNIPIPLYRIGNGEKKILIWSQMHGNESTTTKAVLDFLNYLDNENNGFHNCEIYIIPILNPDGAELYTRLNFNKVDLNRDAQNLTQKESLFLRQIFEKIKPDFCLNLHDQRTIFGVKGNPATISFLAPSVDESRSITLIRKKAMEIISIMNSFLQKYIPGQVGRFDDTFNINCSGDKYSSLGVPTILFEAGHFPNDYEREETRKFIFFSLIEAIKYINDNHIIGQKTEEYFQIPENNKLFCDILIINDYNPEQNIAIQYNECLNIDKKKINFTPKILEIGELKDFKGHKTYKLSEFYKLNNLDLNEINTTKILENIHCFDI